MIEVRELSKRYGDSLVVDQLTFTVLPGVVTGFLGPNGAGKSTTMRMMLELEQPTSGSVAINGKGYHELVKPLTQVGALLDARAYHPGRSARNHVLAIAQSNALGVRRVDAVLDRVGLTEVAHKRVRTFSLGMMQRLGIAVALIGDPGTLLFDEPTNGLDAEGIRWVRTLFKSLAEEGRTVLVSSHLMSEIALTAERLVVLGRGRLIADTTTDKFVAQSSRQSVKVRSPRVGGLAEVLTAARASVSMERDGSLIVSGMDIGDIADAAAKNNIVLHELSPQASLEDAYMEFTESAVEFRGGGQETKS
jgi:ABC-2 type transport system ATP-binding protein